MALLRESRSIMAVYMARGTRQVASLHAPVARGWHLHACAMSAKAKGGPRKKPKRKYGLATKSARVHGSTSQTGSAARANTGAVSADPAGSKLSSFSSWLNPGPRLRPRSTGRSHELFVAAAAGVASAYYVFNEAGIPGVTGPGGAERLD